MIWIIEIPIIFLVIVAMLVGSIQIGGVLRALGILMISIAAVLLLVSCFSDEKRKKKRIAIAGLIGPQGILVLLAGIWFADHSLFEFLFGTGWF